MLRLQEFHENSVCARPRLGGIATTNLALLRERVDRQRSVTQFKRTSSLEEINNASESQPAADVETAPLPNSTDRLDSQISSLHHDVATLSIDVSPLRVLIAYSIISDSVRCEMLSKHYKKWQRLECHNLSIQFIQSPTFRALVIIRAR